MKNYFSLSLSLCLVFAVGMMNEQLVSASEGEITLNAKTMLISGFGMSALFLAGCLLAHNKGKTSGREHVAQKINDYYTQENNTGESPSGIGYSVLKDEVFDRGENICIMPLSDNFKNNSAKNNEVMIPLNKANEQLKKLYVLSGYSDAKDLEEKSDKELANSHRTLIEQLNTLSFSTKGDLVLNTEKGQISLNFGERMRY